MLLEKADVQGYLTTEDLMEFYPDVSKDAERIEAVLVALRRRGWKSWTAIQILIWLSRIRFPRLQIWTIFPILIAYPRMTLSGCT